MTKTHVVDAQHVCEELAALCNAAEMFLRGIFPQGHESAKNHARCLYQLLGDFDRGIVAKSGRSLTTTYLRELWHEIPWKFEFIIGEANVFTFDEDNEIPGGQPLTAEQVKILRRWLELIRNSEQPKREYTQDAIPKALLCQALGVDSSTLQRRVKADPGLIHSSHGKCDQNVRFDLDKLVGTKIYRQADRTAAIEQWNKAKAKPEKRKVR